jgi:hypothetical protein
MDWFSPLGVLVVAAIVLPFFVDWKLHQPGWCFAVAAALFARHADLSLVEQYLIVVLIWSGVYGALAKRT